ncbi:malto-oligosyltrehalose trehalohydrolase [Desulfoscipio sp. XC116]|uniref:malto-oligosyltrehalose trehalohydrolase n=1 Tax=Desulfoscipio sp. XC116 TaxID=3144975 RepID=UPI00325B4030
MNDTLGAAYLGNEYCRFVVWAPRAEQINVRVIAPQEQLLPLIRDERGYHRGTAAGVTPGSLYLYQLDGQKEYPDPASRCQPEGVHGPSSVIDNSGFNWTDHCWRGIAGQDLIIYELHVGTFTPQGTFDAIIPRLEYLQKLGVNAIEIMPIAQFPGERNWGYDGVYPYAAQQSYGGPQGFQRLVNACHNSGLSVILDVVYNHLGPEGNCLADFGPYFTEHYTGPWGNALNFDGPDSDAVRRFFIENALYWLTEFHVDGFRLDAVHAIKDFSAQPFLAALTNAVHQKADRLGRRAHVIAESDLNDARVIQPPVIGGYGMDAQWSDDFHHSLHTLITGEQRGYYRDFGELRHLARAFTEGYVYTGQYSPFRRRRHGNAPRLNTGRQFVVYAQNHDQVGNRACGERLTALTSFAGLKLAACAVFLSPYVPMLFMGEEYGETAPFQYFTSHTDPELAEAVRQGRQKEFSSFAWEGEVPDPQDEATFIRSRLNLDLHDRGRHKALYLLHRELIRLRRELPALAGLNRENTEVIPLIPEKVLYIRRWHESDQAAMVFSFNESRVVTASIPLPAGQWRKLFDTEQEQWLGGGSAVPTTLESAAKNTVTLRPRHCVLFQLQVEEYKPT